MKLRHAIVALASLLLVSALPLLAAEESGSEIYPLEPGGRVSLDNVNGPVLFEGWDRDEVEVQWTKSARHAEDLDRIRVEIQASDRWVEIETHYDRDRSFWGHDSSGEVEYRVKVPRTARLDEVETVNGRLEISGVEGEVRGSTVNGKLLAHDLGGSVELSTVNGRLEVSLTRLAGNQSVELDTVNGSVAVTLPAGANADIDAETVNGSIRNDFGLDVRKGSYVGRSLNGTIGQGGPRLRLESVNGSVEILQGR